MVVEDQKQKMILQSCCLAFFQTSKANHTTINFSRSLLTSKWPLTEVVEKMNLAKEGFFLPLTHLLFSVQGTWNSTNSCLQGKNTKKLSLSKVWCEKQEIDLCYYRNTAFFHQTFVSKSKALVFQFWYNTISGTDFSHQTHSFLVTFFCSVRNVRNCDKDQYFFENQPTAPCKIIFEPFSFSGKGLKYFCKK